MIWIVHVKICPDGGSKTSLSAVVFQRAALVVSSRLTVSVRISMFGDTASQPVSRDALHLSGWTH